MSGVWREQSIPMVDRACALEAFAAIGGHVTTASSSMLQVQMNGQDWTVRHVNGRSLCVTTREEECAPPGSLN